MARNPFVQFAKLFPFPDIFIVEIMVEYADGNFKVEDPAGQEFFVTGPDTYNVADFVYIRDGAITGKAPDLTPSSDQYVP